jgi:hypothetical protein
MHSLECLDFASDSIPGIEIRMAVTAGTHAQLFYITEEDQTWSESKSKRFAITTDGAFHTYFIQLDDILGWSGRTIRQVRLDPTNASTGAKDIKIDYVRLISRWAWEFNADGNNEGWMPVTAPLSDPIWPNNVTGGDLILYSEGSMLDEFTTSETRIDPTLLGPYPVDLPPALDGETRYVQIHMYFQGAGTFSARLRYTLTSDDKLFEYHRSDYGLITRFDLAGHGPMQWADVTANSWHVLTAALPSAGTIDQLELMPTDKAGTVYIDYIRVIYM